MQFNIDTIVVNGESETIEFKSRFNDAAIETLVAFSNTKGGSVVIGIDDNKTLSGYAIGKETVQQILNEIKNKTNSSITPDIETIKYLGADLLIITAFEYPLKPVSFKGRYYKRIANSNHQLNLTEVVQLHNYTYNSSWDYALDSNHSLDDISLDKVNRFIRMANKIRLTPIDEKPENVLKKFELCRDNKISLACFLLFNGAGSILSTVELGRFANDITITDSITLRDDLFSQVDNIIAFLGKHLKKHTLSPGMHNGKKNSNILPKHFAKLCLT
jgi:ATP-dependent DNA helicase RecG